jgi:uncharacterized membrane protein YfcA
LISFPALLAVGYSAVVANVTSTVGIWPGYLGGAAGFRTELMSQRDRVRALAPTALAGGLSGAALLLVTPADVFSDVAPYLILAACALFAVQPYVARKMAARRRSDTIGRARTVPLPAVAGVFAAAVYGGYFGAGLGVILLAVLGLVLTDSLTRINGLRGALALLVNSIAAVTFMIAADVAWSAAGVLAVTSLVGGYTGARLSRRLPAPVLRIVVIAIGLVAAIRLL